ncbi:MAG: hypothetical protein CMC15_16355 [Flavobacteriaceae bacterium]|nr:hypothetical protein [Flavobacteriaceae bacterium]
MKIQGGISIGNIITITMLGFSLALGWGTMEEKTAQIEQDLQAKADQAVVDVQFEYIKRDLAEIKTLLQRSK